MRSKYPDPMDILITKIPNKYLLTCVIFLRAKELNAGEPPLVEVADRLLKEKDYIGIAEEELFEGKLEYEFKEGE